MTPERRELYLSIFDNYHTPHDVLNRLHFLDNGFPTQKLDKALRWLVAHDLTGAAFFQWFKVVCKSSDLEMHRVLLSIVDNAPEGKIIGGVNFRL